MSDMARMTFSLSNEVMDLLEEECAHLGCTKSALVSVIVSQAVSKISDSLSIDQDQPPLMIFDSDRKRLRGKSREIIESEIKGLLEQSA